MPKYGKPIAAERKRRGRPLKYPMDRYAEVLKLRLNGHSLDEIAAETLIPKSSVYRMLDKMGIK